MSVRDSTKQLAPKIATSTLVVVAAIGAYLLYRQYTDRPWTRDGQVRADVIMVAPRVEGYVINVAVDDNQFVRNGELLFQIDPTDYQLAVDKAEVGLDQAREDVAALEAELRAAQATVEQRQAAIMSATAKVDEAHAAVESAQAGVQEAESGIDSAQALIARSEATLEESRREAERAQRLADQNAGSVETAESKAAAVAANQAQLDGAHASLQQARAALANAEAGEKEARAGLLVAQSGLAEAQAAVVTARADKDKAESSLGQTGDANVRIRSANVALEEARLKLEWTRIYAPSDGYITNLYVSEGTFAVAGSSLVAFVDSSTFRVHAYFKETQLRHISPGDRAFVTLMSHSNQPLEGVVDTIGNAVNPPDVAATEGEVGVVPQIQPTFEWIRLAQRVPVTIRLNEVPDNIQLVSGTTASISIEPGNR